MIIYKWEYFLERIYNNPITDIDRYNSDMSQSLIDKLWFVNKIHFDVIVDFGCADGTFLNAVKNKTKLIGYDIDPTMLSKAKTKLGSNALLTDNWEEIENELIKYRNPLLNLSSVIHEVYSYSPSPYDIKDFWDNKVFNTNFKYIAIRDMVPSLSMSKVNYSLFKEDILKIKRKVNKNLIETFEEQWGTLTKYKNFIHFLLKYNYEADWDREVRENYLPISIETLKKRIPSDWKLIHDELYTLPWLKNKVKKDFNIDLISPTHIKILLKNRKFK